MNKLYLILFSLLLSLSSFGQSSDLFISEYAEGNSNNKYLEIYNGTGADVDLSNYSLSNCNNGCDIADQFDYPNTVIFNAGTILANGDVYVIAHPSADGSIVADQTHQFLSNGNDAYALTLAGATADTYTIIDIVGDMQAADPGDGWEVAGIADATKDHTLVRKCSITDGNTDWAASAGTNTDDSEWVVYEINTWDYLGAHVAECSTDPELSIISPSNGEVFPSGTTNVEISFATNNFENGVDGSIEISWPNGSTSIYSQTLPIGVSVEDGIAYTYNLQLLDDSGLPFDPAVTASVSFSVANPMGDPVNLFYSEYAEGSGNNKYFEIYNPTSEEVDLYYYAFTNVSNGSDDGLYEYWNNFADSAVIPPNSVYVVMHGSADESITSQADELRILYHNGNDGQALVYGTEDDYIILDMIGDFDDDPGDGWDVAGVTNATKDHTLVRKSSICQGNTDFSSSAGTTTDDSEWIVYDNNTWDYVGSHTQEDDACNSLSNTENEFPEVSIYPNPANSGIIYIQSTLQGLKQIKLFNLSGKKIMDRAIIGNSLDISSFNSGFYILKVTINGQTKVSKLIIR